MQKRKVRNLAQLKIILIFLEPEDGEKKEAEKEKEPAKPEPAFELLNNPARVTPTQLEFISYDVDPRYTPIVNVCHKILSFVIFYQC